MRLSTNNKAGICGLPVMSSQQFGSTKSKAHTYTSSTYTRKSRGQRTHADKPPPPVYLGTTNTQNPPTNPSYVCRSGERAASRNETRLPGRTAAPRHSTKAHHAPFCRVPSHDQKQELNGTRERSPNNAFWWFCVGLHAPHVASPSAESSTRHRRPPLSPCTTATTGQAQANSSSPTPPPQPSYPGAAPQPHPYCGPRGPGSAALPRVRRARSPCPAEAGALNQNGGGRSEAGRERVALSGEDGGCGRLPEVRRRGEPRGGRRAGRRAELGVTVGEDRR